MWMHSSKEYIFSKENEKENVEKNFNWIAESETKKKYENGKFCVWKCECSRDMDGEERSVEHNPPIKYSVTEEPIQQIASYLYKLWHAIQ